jgi:ribokinase
VIVVIGNPVLRRVDAPSGRPAPAGTAALVAVAAAAAGAQVQLVGRTGDDPAGDELVLALSQAGVGHAALQRVRRVTPVIESPEGSEPIGPADADDREAPESSSSTLAPDVGFDAADVDLAMRYLPDIRVVVISPDVGTDSASVAARAAGWSGATSIRLVADAEDGPSDFPQDSIVLVVPSDDRDGAFAKLVGQYAAALDRGDDPDGAFRRVVDATGWAPATD